MERKNQPDEPILFPRDPWTQAQRRKTKRRGENETYNALEIRPYLSGPKINANRAKTELSNLSIRKQYDMRTFHMP